MTTESAAEKNVLPIPSATERHHFILGIDLGTTTVKICVIDSKTKEVVYEKCRKTNADIADVSAFYAKSPQVKNFDVFSEQDVRKIWTTLNGLLSEVDLSVAEKIKAVGLCGQQHGVVLWNEDSCGNISQLNEDIPQTCLISNLITWQDQRCTAEFIKSLHKPDPDQVIATGYGSCSLYWLSRNAPELLIGFDRSGTIMDFVASLIVQYGQSPMSPQNAEAWGYFDRFNHTWNVKILNASGFPVNLLPGIVDTNLFVGPLRSDPKWHGMTGYANPVGVAMGDLQCSFLASIQTDRDAVFNFSTSAQVSFIRSQTNLPVPPSCDVRTYFGESQTGTESHSGRELIVAPSLNGGNVLTFFVRTLKNWTDQLGGNITEEQIWSKIIPLANEKNWTETLDPVVKPTLFGERFDTKLKASLGDLSLVNCDLGSVVRGILKGVVDNVATMLPGEYLRQSLVTRIVLNGSLFKTFPQLVQYVSKVFGLPVVVKQDDRDAAYGAALATSIMLKEAWRQYL